MERKNLEAQIDSLVSSDKKMEDEIKTLKNVITKDYSRRQNLRFYNIPKGKDAVYSETHGGPERTQNGSSKDTLSRHSSCLPIK